MKNLKKTFESRSICTCTFNGKSVKFLPMFSDVVMISFSSTISPSSCGNSSEMRNKWNDMREMKGRGEEIWKILIKNKFNIPHQWNWRILYLMSSLTCQNLRKYKFMPPMTISYTLWQAMACLLYLLLGIIATNIGIITKVHFPINLALFMGTKH